MLSINYDSYYHNLTETEKKNAPKELYWKGDFSLMTKERRVSVIGARNATREGLKRAEIVTRALVKHDIIVVSGLAKGIDTIAHKTAIKMEGKTIAVLGTSLNNVYPKENAKLFRYIAKNHLAISQFPGNTSPGKKNFPIRNRTMALISDATIIIEASENSGTHYQGWEALRLGRQVYILDNVVKSLGMKWPIKMIEYGAQILKRQDLESALDDIPYLTSKTYYTF